jgi:hypothetical protein
VLYTKHTLQAFVWKVALSVMCTAWLYLWLGELQGHFHQSPKTYRPKHLNPSALLASTPRNSTTGCEQGIRCRGTALLQQHVQKKPVQSHHLHSTSHDTQGRKRRREATSVHDVLLAVNVYVD